MSAARVLLRSGGRPSLPNKGEVGEGSNGAGGVGARYAHVDLLLVDAIQTLKIAVQWDGLYPSRCRRRRVGETDPERMIPIGFEVPFASIPRRAIEAFW